MNDRDDEDLDVFVRHEHRRLVGLLALHVGSREVAEELAQDALARLCEHWPRVRHMSNRRAWLNRVAINLANSALRRRYAEQRANRRHGVVDDVSIEEHVDVLAVRRAVAQLPRGQRTAVSLRFYEQLTVAETAAFMDCPEGTVKSLVHRAIGRLREHADLLAPHDHTERTRA